MDGVQEEKMDGFQMSLELSGPALTQAPPRTSIVEAFGQVVLGSEGEAGSGRVQAPSQLDPLGLSGRER